MDVVGFQFWHRQENVVSAHVGCWTLRVDVDRLDLGISVSTHGNADEVSSEEAVKDGGEALLANAFALPGEHRAVESDFYIRGDDLIVSRPVVESSPIGGEIYFRRVPVDDFPTSPDDVMAIEVLYSIHTHDLDSKPNPSAICRFHDGNLETTSILGASEDVLVERPDSWIGENFVLWRGGTDACIGAGAYPNDVVELSIASEEMECSVQHEATFHLRSSFLEKGVIRRLRMLLVVARDEATVRSLGEQFVDADLPLDT